MLVSSFTQLFLALFADKMSRRQSVVLGLVLFSIGAATCAFSPNIWWLLIGRVVQAVGASFFMMLTYAIPRDICSGTRLAKLYSLLNGIISFSPMLAPFVGSYLDIYFGWSSTFIALFVIVLLVIVLYFPMLPETWSNYKEARSLPYKKGKMVQIIKNPIFFYYTLASSVGLSFLYLFCAISSVVIIGFLNIPESNYGYYFFFMGVSFFLGSVLSAMIVGRIGIYRTVNLGFAISLAGGIIMGFFVLLDGLTIDNFVYPMLLIGLGGTFSMGAGVAGAMQPYAKNAGGASSLSGAMRFLFSAVAGFVFAQNIVASLPLILPAIIFNSILLILFYRRRVLLSSV